MMKYAKIIFSVSVIISAVIIFNSCNKTDSVITPGSSNAAWVKMYGGALSEILTSVQAASSGGFIAAGYTISFGQGNNDIYIVKINSGGDVAWSKTFGSAQNDEATGVLSLSDGTFIVSGRTNSSDPNNYDAFIMKLDASGNKVWDKVYKWNGNVVTTGLQAVSDGYAVSGTCTFTAGQTDAFILKIDPSGNVLWLNGYGGTSNDICMNLKNTSTGYVICGSTFSGGFFDGDGYTSIVNSDGSLGLTNLYGGTGYDQLNDVATTSDNGFITTGVTYSFGLTDGDIIILKTDANGFIYANWPRTIGGTLLDEGSSVIQANDGSFVLAGLRTSSTTTTSDVVLVNYFGDANFNWQREYGGSDNDAAISIIKNSDKYVVGGMTPTGGAGSNDMYIMNLKNDGTCCVTANFFQPNAGSPVMTNTPGNFTASPNTTFTVADAQFVAGNATTSVNTQCTE